MWPYLNIRHINSEKTILHQNTDYFKDYVQTVYAIVPTKLTINADYTHQSGNRNSTHLLCTINIVAVPFKSQSSTPFIVRWLIRLSSVTEHATDDQHLGSLHDTISVAKLSRVRN